MLTRVRRAMRAAPRIRWPKTFRYGKRSGLAAQKHSCMFMVNYLIHFQKDTKEEVVCAAVSQGLIHPNFEHPGAQFARSRPTTKSDALPLSEDSVHNIGQQSHRISYASLQPLIHSFTTDPLAGALVTKSWCYAFCKQLSLCVVMSLMPRATLVVARDAVRITV
jgi:hypothetical protein